MFQIFLGAMDKESVRVVGGNKKGIIDASTLVYKYVFAAGAAADDFLSRGDLMRMVAAWEAVVKHFHEMPIEWIWCFDGPCAARCSCGTRSAPTRFHWHLLVGDLGACGGERGWCFSAP